MKIALPILLGMLAAGPAAAAPYCVQLTGLPLQCLYVDPGQCQHEADKQGGICAANPAEYTTPAGGMPYCTIESGNVANCVFADRQSCSNEARQKNGMCIAATPQRPSTAYDPYELKRPY
jgi:hypothetical protein